MKIFMLSSITISLIYAMSSHPVLLMVLILIQSTGVCVMAWVGLKISWFSYILFLIFLGGLMVLFVYITSLASNETILSTPQVFSSILTAASISTILLMLSPNSQHLADATSLVMKTFYFMYSWNSISLVITTMMYLLLTLIIVIKISNKFEAPLKNLIFN